jgi:hypothetical protein
MGRVKKIAGLRVCCFFALSLPSASLARQAFLFCLRNKKRNQKNAVRPITLPLTPSPPWTDSDLRTNDGPSFSLRENGREEIEELFYLPSRGRA